MLLADLGADVIKVEPPEGDITRAQGPFHRRTTLHAFGGYFASENRNKRRIVLDLRRPRTAGRVLRDLARNADVRRRELPRRGHGRMGLAYETLAARNPKLVYAAIRGFGDPRTGESPYVDWPAYDVVAQAMGGMMGITGLAGGPPIKIGPGVGDIVPATLAALGVARRGPHGRADRRGPVRRRRHERRRAGALRADRLPARYTGAVPGRQGNHHPFLCPFGLYPAADGWVAIASPGDRHWVLLCKAIDRPELATDDRFATNVPGSPIGDRAGGDRELVRRPDVARDRGRPGPPGADGAGQHRGPHRRGPARPRPEHAGGTGTAGRRAAPGRGRAPHQVRPGTGAEPRRAPLLGEHTDAVLAEIGYDPTAVETLRARSAVAEKGEPVEAPPQ